MTAANDFDENLRLGPPMLHPTGGVLTFQLEMQEPHSQIEVSRIRGWVLQKCRPPQGAAAQAIKERVQDKVAPNPLRQYSLV